jgi:hypothetical protein
MRKVTMRDLALLIGMSTLVLATPTHPALAGETSFAETARYTHVCYGYVWKRGRKRLRCNRAYAFSRPLTRPRFRTGDETEQVLQCLLWQPFVTCSASAWDAQDWRGW